MKDTVYSRLVNARRPESDIFFLTLLSQNILFRGLGKPGEDHSVLLRADPGGLPVIKSELDIF